MSNKRVLVVGDPIIDCFTKGTVERLSPESNKAKVFDVEEEKYCLGGCLNVAANISSLSSTKVYALAPMSEYTYEILLNDYNVEMVKVPCYRNRDFFHHYEMMKTRYFVGNSSEHLIRVDNFKKFKSNDIERNSKSFSNLDLSCYEIIVVSDYDKGMIGEDIVKKLSTYEGHVLIDTKKNDLSAWDGIKNKIFKINRMEYDRAINKEAKTIIETRGEYGCILHTKHGEDIKFVGNSVKNPDVVGAGDVFLAGFCAEFLENFDLERACRFANTCSAESVKKFGTVVLDRKDIEIAI